MLGNTPAVARRAYIDPRVFDRYLSGWTIAGALDRAGDFETMDERTRARLERAVLVLLADQHDSPAVKPIGEWARRAGGSFTAPRWPAGSIRSPDGESPP
jgi:hypothetical protein